MLPLTVALGFSVFFFGCAASRSVKNFGGRVAGRDLFLLVRETAGEAEANSARLTGADRNVVVRRDLCAVFLGIDCVLPGSVPRTP